MRQLIFAIDACEWNLVRRWADDGRLPVFRALLERGASGPLSTTAEQLPDTVWSCIYGGRNPATFEKYFYVQYDPRTGDLRHVGDDRFTKTPFWETLSAAGREVGVVDVVKFPRSQALNGFQLVNWGAHATKAETSSLPADLLGEIERAFGKHPVGDCDAVDANPRSQLDLRRRVVEGVRLRGRVMRHLMSERSWDVFVAGFSEPHCIGHHFWHWADPEHPRHGESDPHGLSDSIEQVYRAMDDEMGRMLELAGPDTFVMVVAGHGMGPLYHASWNMPEMLDLLGYGRAKARRVDSRPARTNPWRLLKMAVPGRVQYFIKERLPQRWQDELLFRWYAGDRDWKGHRAFAVPNNDSVGAIRVNVRGRDANGVVAPGAEYDRVVADLEAALLELEDPESGRKVVSRVTRLHEEFAGEYLERLPDLTVSWDQSFPWQRVRSPRFGMLELKNQDGRTGSHSGHGFVIAAGPGVPRRRLEGHSIYDVAPTILSAAGVALPDGLDGAPLPVLPGRGAAVTA